MGEEPVADIAPNSSKKHFLSIDPDGKVNIRFTMKAKMWGVVLLVLTGAAGTGGIEATKVFAQTILGIESPVPQQTQQVEISSPQLVEAVNAATAPLMKSMTNIEAVVEDLAEEQVEHKQDVHQLTAERQAVGEAQVDEIVLQVTGTKDSSEVMQVQIDDVQGTVYHLTSKVEELTEGAKEALNMAEENAKNIEEHGEDIEEVYDKATQIEGQVSLLVRELVDKPRAEAEQPSADGGGL